MQREAIERRGNLLIFDDLRAIQNQYGYLPGEQLETLSKQTKIPLYHIHGVADFFPHFHLTPPPKVRMRVCSDMTCHLLGADALRTGLNLPFHPILDTTTSFDQTSSL